MFLLTFKKNLLFLILIFIISGCYSEESIVDVEKIEAVDNNRSDIKTNYIKIGFDPRWKPVEDVKFYLPLVNYLEKKTDYSFKIIVPPNYIENISMLGKGELDISIMGSVSCIVSQQTYGAYPLVVGLNKNKEPYYRSAIIVKKGRTDIKSIKDVKNKIFAFGNRFSTQGYLIPRYMLDKAKVTMTDIFPTFSRSHDRVAQKVINGAADVGSVQDILAVKLSQQGMVDIVSFSDYFPSSTICASPNTDKEKLDKIKKYLIELDPFNKSEFMENNWAMTEMAGGFTDPNKIDFSKVRELIIKYNLVIK